MKLTNAQVREALQGSIKKWEGIVAGTVEDEGRINCPLCRLFIEEYDCPACPVMVETKLFDCSGSPYADYSDTHSVGDAKRELAFLKRLDHKFFVKGVTVK